MENRVGERGRAWQKQTCQKDRLSHFISVLFLFKKKQNAIEILKLKKKMYHNRSRNYLVYWPACTQRYNHRSWARISFGRGPGATTFHFSSANSFFCCCCVPAYSLVTYLFIYLRVELSVLCDNHIVVRLSSPNPTLKNRRKKLKNKKEKNVVHLRDMMLTD